ncbi:MAG: hypothetical protein IK109_11250 [Clostridiales bacterium]|nr:hypothetical protein [Clostridiales bacterium]MBR5418587.1 hypothetical protein [Clostridiales bacterium]
MKKRIVALATTLTVLASCVAPVLATSSVFYYKDTPVYWDYGRTFLYVNAYSSVLSRYYTHSTSMKKSDGGVASSGNKAPGVTAKVEAYVGFSDPQCYCNVGG